MIIVSRKVIEEYVGRGIDAAFNAAVLPVRALSPPSDDVHLDIIIPIFNAAERVRECVRRVLVHSSANRTVWLVDDASSDPGIGAVLDEAEKDSRVRVVRHPQNLGYVASVNQMLERTTGDVIVLNSDTEVSEGWCRKLQTAASGGNRIGIVCPVSDNATLLTVIAPSLVAAQGSDAMATLVEATSKERFPDIPVAVGFCMYIRRALLDTVGLFDLAFGIGYGEEVDYSLRAWRAGYRIVAATDCFVRHIGGQSFGEREDTTPLRRFNERLINRRWPGYVQWVQNWWRDSPLRLNSERLRRAIKNDPRPGMLHVLHRMDFLGGTEGITRTIIDQVHREFPSTLTGMSSRPLGWEDLRESLINDGPQQLQVNRRYLAVNQSLVRLPADLSQPWAERVFSRLLLGGKYALVHFHHLVHWDSLLLPFLAHRAGARVVISLHDFFYLCPDYVQLRIPGFESCGKVRAAGDTDCEPCLGARRWVRDGIEVPPLGLYLETRHSLIQYLFEHVDVITAPSEFSAQRMRTAFGETVADKLVVIPHGIALHRQSPRAGRTKTLVVGFFGGTVPHKGFGLICDVARQLQDRDVEFQVYGAVTPERVPADLPSSVQCFGKYQPDRMSELLAGMDLVLIPSRFEETFSLILSEAWAAGVPVIASRTGAFLERIRDAEDGWKLDSYSADAWAEKLRLLTHPEGRRVLSTMAQRLLTKEMRTPKDMAEDYLVQYRRLLSDGRSSRRVPLAAAGGNAANGRIDASSAVLERVDQRDPLPGLRPPATSAGPRPRLSAIVFADGNNRIQLTNTLVSLRESLAPATIFVVTDRPDDLRDDHINIVEDLQTAIAEDTGDWYLLLSSGDEISPAAGSWLSLSIGDCDADVVYCDHVHLSAEGYLYAPASAPSPDPVLGLQCPWLSAGCLVSAEVLRGLPNFDIPIALLPAALSLWVAANDTTVHHIPLPLIHRLDVNAARIAHGIQVLSALVPDILGPSWFVTTNETGWTVTPRIKGAPPDTLVVIHGESAAVEETRTVLSTHVFENVAVASLPELEAQPDLAENCRYILHLPAGARFHHPGWLDTLRAWAVYRNAALVAPKLSGFPSGYRLNLFGNAHAASDPVDSPYGIGPLDWFPANRSNIPVLPHCVLMDREAFDADHCLHWPDVAPDAQLDAQAGALVQGREVLWIRDVVAQIPSTDSGPRQIPLSPRHHALAQQPRWIDYGPHPTRPRSDCLLAGLDKTKPCVIGSARNRWAAAQYRVDIPLNFLHEEGCIESPLVYRTGNESPPSAFEVVAEQADALMAHNFISDPALDRLSDYRNLSIRVIASLDDLLTQVPDYNTFSRTYPDIEARLKRALSYCDRLIVSTPLLAEFMNGYCDDIVVVPNALPESSSDWPWRGTEPAERRKRKRLRVGWVGAGQHAGDLEAFVDVVEKTCRDVDWVFFGMCPEALRPKVREVHPMVPFEQYPERLRAMELDVGVAPLIDNAFNRCKSNIKLLEYGVLGIPVIASDLEPYQGTPVELAGKGDDWVDLIMHYAGDRQAGVEAGRKLRDWVMAEHLMLHRKNLWLRALGLENGTT